MERMMNLRETVARALAAQDSAYDDRHWEAYTAQADAALAALGLDDLDAAVERGAKALVWEQHQGCVRWEDTTDSSTTGDAHTRNYAREHALAVLNAALLATETKGSPDG